MVGSCHCSNYTILSLMILELLMFEKAGTHLKAKYDPALHQFVVRVTEGSLIDRHDLEKNYLLVFRPSFICLEIIQCIHLLFS